MRFSYSISATIVYIAIIEDIASFWTSRDSEKLPA